MFFFLDDYSQSDEKGILDVLHMKIFFFAAHTVGGLLKNVFKIIFVDFTLWWWCICNFLEKEKKR